MKIKDGRETITSKIAYIAGFFDGEGCVRIKKANKDGNSYYVWVAITNSNRAILEEIAELFGGKVRQAERAVNKVIYHYLITSAEAVDFLKTIRCFLQEKRAQADTAIYFHENKGSMPPHTKYIYEQRLREMKREIIGNIYENENLLTK